MNNFSSLFIKCKCSLVRCNIKEGVATYRLITEYLRLVAAQKPVLVSQIVREVQEKCNAYQSVEDIFDVDEIDLDGLDKNILDKLKCISNAITDGLKETDFEQPWDYLKKDLEKLAARLKACKNQSTFLEIAKWDFFKEVIWRTKTFYSYFFADALLEKLKAQNQLLNVSLKMWKR